MPEQKTEVGTFKIEYDVIATPNGYGFGHDWQLQVTERGHGGKIYRTAALFLGQDVKVAMRLLGLRDTGQLIDETVAAGLSDNWDDRKVREYVAGRIVEAIAERYHGDQEVGEFLLTCEPWTVAVE